MGDFVMIAAGWRGQMIRADGISADFCKHGPLLKELELKEPDHQCDRCAHDLEVGEKVLQCETCDYDICVRCRSKLTGPEHLAVCRFMQIVAAPTDYEAFVAMMQ